MNPKQMMRQQPAAMIPASANTQTAIQTLLEVIPHPPYSGLNVIPTMHI
jgi:hypothetical protein